MKRRPKNSTGGTRRPWWSAVTHPEPQRPPSPPTTELFLSSTGCFVTVEEALGDGCLSAAVVDDLLWRVAVEEWHARQPRNRWSSARRRWLQEYDTLCAERARITEVARFYGAGEPRRL